MTNPKRTHRDRLEACLSGAQVDRPPVALWRHFPVDDQQPGSLAAATLQFQRTYDFDFVKFSPASSYCLKDWGAQDEWRGSAEGNRQYTHHPIQSPDDWTRLQPLDPNSGYLAQNLESLRLVTAELSPETPVIATVFSPLSQARNLAGAETLLAHLRQYPQQVKAGLTTIALSIQRFIESALPTGIAGVFYAVQHAQYGVLSEAEFREFGKTFDEQALQPAQELWLNLLHLHGQHVMFEQIASYPMAIINWHDQETPPSLAQALTLTSQAVCGGLRQWQTMAYSTPADVEREARAAIAATGGQRFILGTGCVTPIITPHGNLLAARRSVEG